MTSMASTRELWRLEHSRKELARRDTWWWRQRTLGLSTDGLFFWQSTT